MSLFIFAVFLFVADASALRNRQVIVNTASQKQVATNTAGTAKSKSTVTEKTTVTEKSTAMKSTVTTKSSARSVVRVSGGTLADTLRELEKVTQEPSADKRLSASMTYVLGMDFSPILDTLPEDEKEICIHLSETADLKLAQDIQKEFPEVRPEIREPLAYLARKTYLDGAEVKEVNQEIQHLADLKLTSSEVLAVNEVIAGCIDPEEFKAIEGLNRFRMRSGLRPCLIDLLLVNASRGHSGDMRRLGFFSHNSPVSGKSTFTMRARQAGASASGENIYMGSSNGEAANVAWINSPGHRANMLGGHSRVGVGRVGGHFTQMFGR